MLGFLKKIFGFPTQEEVTAAKAAPYKVETPVVNTKTGDLVDMPVPTPAPEPTPAPAPEPTPAPAPEPTPAPAPVAELVVEQAPVVAAAPVAVNSQITDAVTQAPAKKTRKPRTPKAEKPAKEKAAKPAKAAAKKVAGKRSKKA